MRKLGRSALIVAVVVASFGGSLITEAGAASSGPSSAAAHPLAPAAIGDPSTFVSLAPQRIVDTRDGTGGVQGPLANESTTSFQVIGAGGVPTGATSVVLNVTAVDPEGTGFFTVFPSGSPRPDTSNLNVVAGKNVANLVVARIGADGKVNLYNFGGRAHVIFDVTGYFVSGTGAGRFNALVPARRFDSRINQNSNGTIVPIGQAGTFTLALVGQLPSASHWSSVLVNITATNATAGGFFTVYPAGDTLPKASNLNFTAGQTVANAVIVKVGPTPAANSGITIFNAFGTTDFIVDILGVFDDGTTPAGLSNPLTFRALDQPERVFSTRVTGGPIGAREVRFANVTGAGGAPPGAGGVIGNATVTATTGGSYLSIWPAGLTQPTVSSINWSSGDTVPNLIGVGLVMGAGGTAGQLAFYNDAGSTDVLFDVAGYFYPV